MARNDVRTVRRMRDGECDEVRHLILRTIDACYPPAYCEEAVQFFKEHHAVENIRKRAHEGHTLVIEIDGAIVATGSVIGNNLQALFVDPPFQERGYGKALMHRLEEIGRDNNAEVFTLDASLVSIGLYLFLGYVTVEEVSIDVGAGKTLDFHKMEKSVKGA